MAHTSDGTVSVLAIDGKTVKQIGSVKVGDEKSRVGDVAISLEDMKVRIKVKGHPAAIRIAPR